MHTTPVLNPKGTHTWMIERHHDLLRQLYSKIRYQANEEGIPYDDDDILAMAVMAKNCMITVGQYSPQTAVFGTQPGILPDQDREQSHLEDAEDGILSRNTHRLREIALQEIITITAIKG